MGFLNFFKKNKMAKSKTEEMAKPIQKPAVVSDANQPSNQAVVSTQKQPVKKEEPQKSQFESDLSKNVKSPKKDESDETLKELHKTAGIILNYCNQQLMVSATQVVDTMKLISPQVEVVPQHPSPDAKNQTCFFLTLKGKSLRVPESGHLRTRF